MEGRKDRDEVNEEVFTFDSLMAHALEKPLARIFSISSHQLHFHFFARPESEGSITAVPQVASPSPTLKILFCLSRPVYTPKRCSKKTQPFLKCTHSFLLVVRPSPGDDGSPCPFVGRKGNIDSTTSNSELCKVFQLNFSTPRSVGPKDQVRCVDVQTTSEPPSLGLTIEWTRVRLTSKSCIWHCNGVFLQPCHEHRARLHYLHL